jgi:4a-hydroxytetrahydrobiopterin dehydratase
VSLAEKRCLPCEGGTPPLSPSRARELLAEIPEWKLAGERLRRPFRFRDFRGAMRFANAVADLAEAEGHHPDLFVHDWNQVEISTWTHAIGGLSENDFVLAAKIDRLPADPAIERR